MSESTKDEKPNGSPLNLVRTAIACLQDALNHSEIKENGDPVVCIAEGRLMGALESTKEALSALEDMLD